MKDTSEVIILKNTITQLRERNKELTRKLEVKERVYGYNDIDFISNMDKYYFIMKDIIIGAREMDTLEQSANVKRNARRFLEGRY